MEPSLTCINTIYYLVDIRPNKSIITEYVYLSLQSKMTIPLSYTCDDCDAAFLTMAELNDHYKHDHPKAHAKLTKDVSC